MRSAGSFSMSNTLSEAGHSFLTAYTAELVSWQRQIDGVVYQTDRIEQLFEHAPFLFVKDELEQRWLSIKLKPQCKQLFSYRTDSANGSSSRCTVDRGNTPPRQFGMVPKQPYQTEEHNNLVAFLPFCHGFVHPKSLQLFYNHCKSNYLIQGE